MILRKLVEKQLSNLELISEIIENDITTFITYLLTIKTYNYERSYKFEVHKRT